ncbi:MAG: S1/P1 Nuclease [Thermoflavifilum sp.]|jgi:hypothetical protein|uniref:zinc dependent phospholipase C family protein n=1 Tax=Thermoflavifilum sp. TaxID=1968839 RepID=UPI0018A66AEF|nr:zinc dependent phospholipase C family protein [Thermoflavifilum sp.]QOR76849.1 MAG: S1/P1 Nuclease [Thermoflavifilum sp.]
MNRNRICWLCLLVGGLLSAPFQVSGWGFFAHACINHQAVYSLPPEMQVFFKPYQAFLTEHAADADRRKFILHSEAPRHYFDADAYDTTAWPCNWQQATLRWPAETLQRQGVLPWYALQVYNQLVEAFRRGDGQRVLKLSADLGHYIADACVPLHACSNYDGQFTGQHGIHALWETAIPERLYARFHLWVGKARYLPDPASTLWQIIRESARASDTVLVTEKYLRAHFPKKAKYGYYLRNNQWVRGYSTTYLETYEALMHQMVERRMQQAILAVASFWYTAWVNAGQPDLQDLMRVQFTHADSLEWHSLQRFEWDVRKERMGSFKE